MRASLVTTVRSIAIDDLRSSHIQARSGLSLGVALIAPDGGILATVDV